MILKAIMDENFQDYKKPSMMLAASNCDWKCLKEQDLDINVCQNSELCKQKEIDVSIDDLVNRYIGNKITKAVVIGGLEPMLQFNDIVEFIELLRQKCNDDVVIYTGYYPEEIPLEIEVFKMYSNIIVKFGRYIPNKSKVFDDVLGVELISDNQYAVKIC